jgi:hypothetical protein
MISYVLDITEEKWTTIMIDIRNRSLLIESHFPAYLSATLTIKIML